MLSFWPGVGGGVPVSISWAKPRMAFSGERSSWLMLERKSDFARFASSAATLAFCSSRWLSCSTASRRCALGLDLLARRVVGADQQVADDGVGRVLQRRHRHHGRQAAAVLADVGQLVDVLDAAPRLEHQRLEARRDGRAQFDAQRLGARHQFLRGRKCPPA